ncbi:Cysteine-rich RLK (RECEPTOR-like protein kinase) 8, putative [Theobroma cacao]|uniref:Cysteine-rich RLK (RECEPTOR-like protein kinase) 8, putative n=1 Tax=Theobroma cacao TaxID=3641 RepID=A0A061GU12_THECC|nr:Cysteine-rich RLK (RECEPTOR-like protein kinase) 8, putative [Theobroma cacao]
MTSELQTLNDNGTWTIVHLPSNSHVIGYRRVYKVKLNTNGDVERFKTHWVAKGYNKKPSFDYQETLSLVAKQLIVRVFLALTVACNWQLSQLDINNACLNGDLEEEVYMELPEGYFIKGEYFVDSKMVVVFVFEI